MSTKGSAAASAVLTSRRSSRPRGGDAAGIKAAGVALPRAALASQPLAKPHAAHMHWRLQGLCSHALLLPWATLAVVMAMSVSEQMALAQVKNRLSEVVERLEREHGRVVITKHGRPAAVVLSGDDPESLEETLDVLSNDALLADIRQSLGERSSAPAPVLSEDEALTLLRDGR